MKFNPDKQIIVKSDASDYITGEILPQFDFTNALWLVPYFSKTHLCLM